MTDLTKQEKEKLMRLLNPTAYFPKTISSELNLPAHVASLANGKLSDWIRDYPEGYLSMKSDLETRLSKVSKANEMEWYELRAIADKVRSDYAVSRLQAN
jgi:hypothetical protein